MGIVSPRRIVNTLFTRPFDQVGTSRHGKLDRVVSNITFIAHKGIGTFHTVGNGTRCVVYDVTCFAGNAHDGPIDIIYRRHSGDWDSRYALIELDDAALVGDTLARAVLGVEVEIFRVSAICQNQVRAFFRPDCEVVCGECGGLTQRRVGITVVILEVDLDGRVTVDHRGASAVGMKRYALTAG